MPFVRSFVPQQVLHRNSSVTIGILKMLKQCRWSTLNSFPNGCGSTQHLHRMRSSYRQIWRCFRATDHTGAVAAAEHSDIDQRSSTFGSSSTLHDADVEDDDAQPASKHTRSDRRVARYSDLAQQYGLGDGSLRPNPKLRSSLTPENAEKILLETMVPLYKIDYQQQLRFKYERAQTLVHNITRRLMHVTPNIPLTEDGLICDVKMTCASPETHGFRNKSEYAAGVGVDGNRKTVGYHVGRMRDNEAVVVPAFHLPNTPSLHAAVGQAFQDFVRMSPLPCYEWSIDPPSRGYWRGITVRTNRAGDIMAIVHIHPQKLTPHELNQQMHAVRSYFTAGPGGLALTKLKSLYFQACPNTRCNHYEAPFRHLAGDHYIYEQLGTKKFRISPGSFYQLNPGAAEVLYDTIRGLLQPDGNGCLLDVCCGTGTIGIYLADRYRKVIGCDIEALSIDDAIYNSRVLNKLTNCEFYHKTAEDAVPALAYSFDSDEDEGDDKAFSRISVVVNPSRAGLDWPVIRALRQCAAIDDVVYVSCKPLDNAMRNITELCMPYSKRFPGEPFYPTRVVPVDMFPNTEHCELVFMYQRNRVHFH